MSNPNERYQIAIHEAGHAVMSILLKGDISYVTIIESEEYYGLCKSKELIVDEYEFYSSYKDKDYNDYKRYIEQEIMINFSGPIAVGASEFPCVLHTNESVKKDIEDSIELALGIVGDVERVEGVLIELWGKAVGIIRKPLTQQQIKAVADALMKHKTLSGTEVRRIMGDVAK
ncbi:MAG TPA: hypothetical protein PKA10_13975 [Selenomonadales bacterium]|nr:hypothetical protein [Selenomonadales bacterium]